MGRWCKSWHTHASVSLQVEVPAHEEACGGWQPGQYAPNANVGVPVGGQVAAVESDAADGSELEGERRGGAGCYAQRQKKDMRRLKAVCVWGGGEESEGFCIETRRRHAPW